MRIFLLIIMICGIVSTARANDVNRGEYLARAADCGACHTASPAVPFAGGRPFNSATDYVSPGFIYSTNITPDKVTGIGTYTLQDFERALRKGVTKDGRHLYPAMPYPSFSKLTDQDIADLYAYFMKSVKPIRARPPETKLSFPFNQRWTLAVWDFIFAPRGVWKPQEDKDTIWNRGSYLVEGPGHCGACHTPRNLFYQERGYTYRSLHFLSGSLLDHWFAPSLRCGKASGLGRWSENEIVSFLKTGHNAYGASFGSMNETIEESLQHLSNEDLYAIAHYLKSLPANHEDASYLPGMSRKWPPGAGIYAQYCSACHGAEGRGKPPSYPPLAGNPIVLAPDIAGLARLVLEGGEEVHTVFGPAAASMPAFQGKLGDTEIANVLSYIRNSWGNKSAPVTERDVKRLRVALDKERQHKKTVCRTRGDICSEK